MGKRTSTYTTKQSKSVLEYLEMQRTTHLTAAQIIEHFEKDEMPIGRATVYRQLEKLTAEGKVRKYMIYGTIGTCFQFIPESEREQKCYHLKCDHCGRITNLHCDTCNFISRHFAEDHEFQIDDERTVFYGKCKACLQNE